MNLESGGQFGDVAGGAGDESTQRADVSAFLQWGLVPRMPASSAVAPQTVSD